MAQQRKVVIGIAWYRPQDWMRLREISADRDKLEESHAEWLAVANGAVRRMERAGQPCRKMIVGLDELVAWCKSEQKPVDGESRADFASWKLRQEELGGAAQQGMPAPHEANSITPLPSGGAAQQSLQPPSKRIKKLCREAAGLAYQRELDAELGKLHADFERWRRGELSAFELSDRIHRFHQGPNRRLWSRYDGRDADWNVAVAVHKGILRLEELDPDLVAYLQPQLMWCRQTDGAAEKDQDTGAGEEGSGEAE